MDIEEILSQIENPKVREWARANPELVLAAIGYNLPPGVTAEDIPDYVEGFDSDAELEAHNAAYELWEFSLLRNRREHQWKRLRSSYSLTSWEKVKKSLSQWRFKQR